MRRNGQGRHQKTAEPPHDIGQRDRIEGVPSEKGPPLDFFLGVLGKGVGEAEGYTLGDRGCAPLEGRADRLAEGFAVEVRVGRQDPEVAKWENSPSFMRLLAMPSTTRTSSFSATTVSRG